MAVSGTVDINDTIWFVSEVKDERDASVMPKLYEVKSGIAVNSDATWLVLSVSGMIECVDRNNAYLTQSEAQTASEA